TGMPSLDYVLRAVNEGEIYRFVTKPWVSSEMLAILKSAIQRFELIQANRQLREESIALNSRLAAANTLLDKKVRELEIKSRQLDESRAALENSYHRTLELCRRILNTFNPLLAAQARLAHEICESLVAQGQFTQEERKALLVSSRIYDIGLTGIPPSTLLALQSENSNTDESSKKIYREHTIYGQELAYFIDASPLVAAAIRSHHERPDGTGFPDGLRSNEIPWIARCLAVVATYVTKASTGLPHEQILEQLLLGSGSAFDPKALQLFIACVQKLPEVEKTSVRQVRIEDLQPGMLLASDLTTPSGLVLYSKGQRLDEQIISRLRKEFRSQLFNGKLEVVA
ncbi:MAG: hypothetical protein NZL93_04700, partial [Chthoniobacterales bacterium]|nr:hypothetical protein [Chthoniobacterales bacterium]